MDNIVPLRSERSSQKRPVRVMDGYAEMTGRDHGLTGEFLRWERPHPDIAVINIGEKSPVRVHRNDFIFIS